MQRSRFIAHVVLGAIIITGASTLSGRAVTITGLAESQDNLSFAFSGEGFGDFISNSLPPLNFWTLGTELHAQDPATLSYGFAFIFVEHLTGSNPGPVSLGNISPTFAAYGTTLSSTKSIAHDSGFDSYSLSITVNEGAHGEWGAFSGLFSASHSGSSVPDTGSTAALVGLSFLFLVTLKTGARSFAGTNG